MQKVLASLAIVAACSAPALAQQLELPRPSPNAKIVQNVGLTEITIDYSSPAVRGRKIWGGLVPFNEVWRAGANAATKITFNKDVTFGTTAVPAGSYALFVIPTANAWTVILNKDFAQAGAFNYKKELDVARLEVKPETIPNRERLAYVFSDFTNEGGTIDLEWEKARVRIPFKVATEAQVTAGLKGFEEMGAWMPANQAARYFLEQKKDYDQGIVWADRSLKIKEDWFNVWTKAQLLHAKGDLKAAQPLAAKALALGEKVPPQRFFFAEEVKKAVTEWKAAPAKK